jgi:Predicted phosphohydrolases
MAQLKYPDGVKHIPGYWLRPSAAWAARQKMFRRDNSTDWRRSFPSPAPPNTPDRSVPFDRLLGEARSRLRIIILGDTGEGDRSQHGFVPLLRRLNPDLMIINGDVAYPAGREEDFLRGFFRPYASMGIPIWAVPGNHEYYSRDKGGTFHATFCTRQYADEWSKHGLKLVPQPGTYWELRGLGIAILGIDSGMTGDLDGKRAHGEDREQHRWLAERLAAAERDRLRVVALFHIPALSNGEIQKKPYLNIVHGLLARSPAVRLVVCGHTHNLQYHEPAGFDAFLVGLLRAPRPAGLPPLRYAVCGGGGSYLSRPPIEGRGFAPAVTYPTRSTWDEHAIWGRRAVEKVGLGRWAIGRIVGIVEASVRDDGDAAKYLSGLFLEVDGQGARVRAIKMDDLAELYAVPPNTVVDIGRDDALLDPQRVEATLAGPPNFLL